MRTITAPPPANATGKRDENFGSFATGKAEPGGPALWFLSNHSERDVFVDRPALGFDVVWRNVSGTCSEKLHAECNNLGTVLLRPSIAGLPHSRPQAPLDVDLT